MYCPFAFLKRYEALAGGLGDKAPDDVTKGKERHIVFELDFENVAVDHAEQGDKYSHADRDPERPQHGASVSLADIVPAEHGP